MTLDEPHGTFMLTMRSCLEVTLFGAPVHQGWDDVHVTEVQGGFLLLTTFANCDSQVGFRSFLHSFLQVPAFVYEALQV